MDGAFCEGRHRYQPPVLVLFNETVQSACGSASAATGPFYCPADSKVYLDLSFFRELDQNFGAPGDFAQAYVVAHEVGHHVQNVLGVNAQVSRLQQQASRADANQLSVRLELQADCYAGVWGHYAARQDMLEPGDVDEGLRAAAAIGDDRLQRQSQGRVVPESFTHGSSEQRAQWLRQGLSNGRIEDCDTFQPAAAASPSTSSPDLRALVRRQVQLVALLHAERGIELADVPHRRVGPEHLGGVRIGHHLLPPGIVAHLARPHLCPSHVEALDCR